MNKFATKYGRFSEDATEYIITTPRTPRPWINVISNGDYGLTFSQTGGGYSWRTHAQLNRITRWEQDLIKDDWGKYIYLTDEKNNIWSAGWKPVCHEPDFYRCRHGMGYSIIESTNFGIETELLVFVPRDEPVEVWRLTVRNRTRRERSLNLFTYFEWGLGKAPDWHREFHKSFIETEYDGKAHALLATKRLWEVPTARGHWNASWGFIGFHSSSLKPVSYDGDKESFLGMYGSLREPKAVRNGKLQQRTGNWLDPIGSLHDTIKLKPGEEKVVCFTLGAAENKKQAMKLINHYRSIENTDKALEEVKAGWKSLLRTVDVSTPDEAMNIMTNTWLKYQGISGRLWGRSAYYQTGGAFGFRDQLQDSQIFLPIDSERTKNQILLHARHQFYDGTVYHWWHPISEIGLRNGISDNMLWLPFVVNSYLQESNDFQILDCKEPFVDNKHEASIYTHCTKAIDRALLRMSKRGLPYIGSGDWNDGLSAVGLDMKGESVWLAHFLHRILLDFAQIAKRYGENAKAGVYLRKARKLKVTINKIAWDGKWYWRATKDSGEKLGSSCNKEGKIFLNSQTWSIIAGVADKKRAEQVMDVVEKKLEYKAGPLLLYPAYKTPDKLIGYLTRYSPGMRENGGVYTHAATWSVIAEALLKRGDSAYRMYSKINPIYRGMDADDYVAEPYVTPGNIEGPESDFYGRGGWTWYTGSAAWLFIVGLEWILGIRPTFDGLVIDPCIPAAWKGYKVRREFRGATYSISITNPEHIESGIKEILIDGEEFCSNCKKPPTLPVFNRGTVHFIEVIMGTAK